MVSPLSAAPQVVQRTQLVEQAMERLVGLDELSTSEQLELLGHTADLLAGVLRGDDVAQLGIPGLG